MIRRRLRTFAASLLLTLCTATIAASLLAMWRLPVRQDWSLFGASRGYISLTHLTSAHTDEIVLDGDGISFGSDRAVYTRDPVWRLNLHDRHLDLSDESVLLFQPAGTRQWIDLAGIYLFTGTPMNPAYPSHWPEVLILRIPYWLIVTLAAIFPIWMGSRFLIRKRRVLEGHCPNCGYDLRATPERCRECGMTVSQTNTAHKSVA